MYSGRLRIRTRLTLSFVIVGLLMLAGVTVSLWQFNEIRNEAQRMSQIDVEALAALHVHVKVLTFCERLRNAVDSQSTQQFVTVAGPLRESVLAAAEQAKSALQANPKDAQRHALLADMLSSVSISLTTQTDIMLALAKAGDWEALQLRFGKQVQAISQITSNLVEQVDAEVNAERSQMITEIDSAVRQAILTLILTALATMIVAGMLGFSLTQHIAQPLAGLVEGSRALARGEFEHRVIVTGQDELADLGRVFNDTSAQVRDLYEAQRRSEARFRSLIECAGRLDRGDLPPRRCDVRESVVRQNSEQRRGPERAECVRFHSSGRCGAAAGRSRAYRSRNRHNHVGIAIPPQRRLLGNP